MATTLPAAIEGTPEANPGDCATATAPEPAPLIARGARPLKLIEFGEPEWQSHLGGDFAGIERDAATGISSHWIGGGRAWCVIPNLPAGADYILRLEAAPLVPYGSRLQELRLVVAGETLARRYLPAEATSHSQPLAPLSRPVLEAIAAHARDPRAAPLHFEWRAIDSPQLEVAVNGLLATHLRYLARPDAQPREFLLRSELLRHGGGQHAVVSLHANFALEPDGLANERGDDRALSFRLYRLAIFPMPATVRAEDS